MELDYHLSMFLKLMNYFTNSDPTIGQFFQFIVVICDEKEAVSRVEHPDVSK
jgi:hypothetical protein